MHTAGILSGGNRTRRARQPLDRCCQQAGQRIGKQRAQQHRHSEYAHKNRKLKAARFIYAGNIVSHLQKKRRIPIGYTSGQQQEMPPVRPLPELRLTLPRRRQGFRLRRSRDPAAAGVLGLLTGKQPEPCAGHGILSVHLSQQVGQLVRAALLCKLQQAQAGLVCVKRTVSLLLD